MPRSSEVGREVKTITEMHQIVDLYNRYKSYRRVAQETGQFNETKKILFRSVWREDVRRDDLMFVP
jgi:hypothetical protein